MHGDMGTLAGDWHSVQCHLCGGWYSHLGAHVTHKHELTVGEYKEMFGLKATTGLISPELADKRRRSCAHLRVYDEQARQRMRELGAEFRRAYQTGRKPRLEVLLDPARKEHMRKFNKAGREGAARARAAGTYKQSKPPSADDTRKAHKELAKKRQDPEFQKWHGQRISEGKGGALMEIRTCRWCGADFEIRASSKRRTCSKTCHKSLKADITRNQQHLMQPGKYSEEKTDGSA